MSPGPWTPREVTSLSHGSNIKSFGSSEWRDPSCPMLTLSHGWALSSRSLFLLTCILWLSKTEPHLVPQRCQWVLTSVPLLTLPVLLEVIDSFCKQSHMSTRCSFATRDTDCSKARILLLWEVPKITGDFKSSGSPACSQNLYKECLF